MNPQQLKNIVEAALLAAGEPLSLDKLLSLFAEHERPERDVLREALTVLGDEYAGRGIELVEVGSGFRLQVRQAFAPWISKLWEERPPRYSRALLETLALIAYRQPITRGDIEEIRGVSVSTNIFKTLMERDWVRVVGHREVPGRPALYGTTRQFLDDFNLKTLNQLPPLSEIQSLEDMAAGLAEPDSTVAQVPLADDQDEDDSMKPAVDLSELVSGDELLSAAGEPPQTLH